MESRLTVARSRKLSGNGGKVRNKACVYTSDDGLKGAK